MAKDRLTFLLKEYDALVRRNEGKSPEAIEILKAVVQTCVEKNNDKAAYDYQQKVCDAIEAIYGQTDIRLERARLYCRELGIRSAPLTERVRLCRAFWQDVKKDYGEDSVVVRIVAPLYLNCCYEAQEIEELRLVCSEVVAVFGKDGDEESRMLAASCRDFDILLGEKTGDIQQIEAACRRAEAAFGRGSEYELHLRREIGYLYRAKKEYGKAAEIHGDIFRLSRARYGRNALITILMQKEYALDLAFAGHLRAALAETKRLEHAVKMCPDRNQCPDIYECFVNIYRYWGKEKLVEKYCRMSVSFCEENYGPTALETLKAKYILAGFSLVSRPEDNCGAFREMLEYMAAKEQRLYNIYLLSSDIGREKYFTLQNRGEYDVCLGLALSRAVAPMTDEVLILLWEVACNYKTLVGDCEFLHSAVRKRTDMAKELDGLRRAMQSKDRGIASEAERRLLQLSREDDFPGYVNSVHVRDIQSALGEDELLLDYYCVHFSDLEVYAVMAVTRHSLALLQAGSISEVDGLTGQVIRDVCGNKPLGFSNGAEDQKCSSEGSLEQLLSRLYGSLVPSIQAPARIIICPDGELFHFSFELLFRDAAIVYVTNPKDIARGRTGAPQDRLPVQTVSVFADPLFDPAEGQTPVGVEEAAPERSDRFRRLPGTLMEAGVIREIYGNKVSEFTRRDANRKMFLEHCRADILHLGTHADSENGGRIYLAGAGGVEEEQEHPVYGRGYITSKDISALNMRGTRLAVLSACRTGLGEYRSYLGVRGLRRAFQIAGVHTVIATLWNISDIATAVFMYEFYRKYCASGNSTAALYHAKNYLKTATVREMRERIYPFMSDILADAGCIEAYKELRDLIWYGRDEEKPFSSPYYWAAFSVYDSFGGDAAAG